MDIIGMGVGKIPLLYKVRSVEKSSRRNYVTRFGSNAAALAQGSSDAYEAIRLPESCLVRGSSAAALSREPKFGAFIGCNLVRESSRALLPRIKQPGVAPVAECV